MTSSPPIASSFEPDANGVVCLVFTNHMLQTFVTTLSRAQPEPDTAATDGTGDRLLRGGSRRIARRVGARSRRVHDVTFHGADDRCRVVRRFIDTATTTGGVDDILRAIAPGLNVTLLPLVRYCLENPQVTCHTTRPPATRSG